jgi:hypothetical protein
MEDSENPLPYRWELEKPLPAPRNRIAAFFKGREKIDADVVFSDLRLTSKDADGSALNRELNFSRAATTGVLSLRDTFSEKWSC